MLLADQLGPERGAVVVETEQAFRRTMPEQYLADFGASAITEHARIVGGRRGAFVHVEACSHESPAGSTEQWLCVVTDDRPGLLSLLAVAISAHDLDVKDARVYCRTPPGRPREAIDFFAVQSAEGAPPGPLAPELLGTLREAIAGLLSKDTDIEWLVRRSSPSTRLVRGPHGPAAPTARAAFLPDRDRDVLVVETEDRPSLLLSITLALYRRRLSIARSRITTLGSLARDDFELTEFDGARLTEPRRREALGAVVAAIGRIASEQAP